MTSHSPPPWARTSTSPQGHGVLLAQPQCHVLLDLCPWRRVRVLRSAIAGCACACHEPASGAGSSATGQPPRRPLPPVYVFLKIRCGSCPTTVMHEAEGPSVRMCGCPISRATERRPAGRLAYVGLVCLGSDRTDRRLGLFFVIPLVRRCRIRRRSWTERAALPVDGNERREYAIERRLARSRRSLSPRACVVG